MLINYKLSFLNYFMMILSTLVITILQNSLWPSFFGTNFPIYLWIPFLIYWALYRKTGETVFMVYFITLSVASTSSVLTGYLLSCNSLVLLTLLVFKRIYYTSRVFFSTACALTLMFFPILLWLLSQIMNGRTFYFYGFIPYLTGAVVTWIFSFPLLNLFQWIDNLTITKSAKHSAGVL